MAGKALSRFVLERLALTVWIVAILVSVLSWIGIRRAPARFRARQADYAAILRQEREIMEGLEARRTVMRERAHADQPAPDLELLARFALEGAATSRVAEIARFDLDGGTAIRVAIDAEQAPLAGLSGLIEEAEAGDPPWRLVSLAIEAGPIRPGQGRVSLMFESVTVKRKSE